MRHLFTLSILLTVVIMLSCKSTKKPTEQVVKDDNSKLINSLLSKNIEFSTFDTKGKLQYDDGSTSMGGQFRMKMKRNEFVWISVTKFGFEGARALITKDSIYAINRLEKKYQKASINELQRTYNIPGDITDLQDFIIGNIVQVSELQLVEGTTNNFTQLYDGNRFTYVVNPESLKPQKGFIIDANNQKVDFTFQEYTTYPKGMFSNLRNYLIQLPGKQIKADLSFIKTDWDVPVDMPFEIPSGYKLSKF